MLKRVTETMWVSDLYQGRVVCVEVSQSNVKWKDHHASWDADLFAHLERQREDYGLVGTIQ